MPTQLCSNERIEPMCDHIADILKKKKIAENVEWV